MEPVRDIRAPRLRRSRGVPNRAMSPLVGARRPSSIFMVVDLPEPLGPRKP